jgi:HxlR-like helix-turn-helix
VDAAAPGRRGQAAVEHRQRAVRAAGTASSSATSPRRRPTSESSPARPAASPTRSCPTALSDLAETRLIARTLDEGPPLAVSNALTDRGAALIPALEQISLWAQEHLVPDED